jgi:hypothetical protein
MGNTLPGDVDETYLERLKNQRNDMAKQGQNKLGEASKGNQIADINTELL